MTSIARSKNIQTETVPLMKKNVLFLTAALAFALIGGANAQTTINRTIAAATDDMELRNGSLDNGSSDLELGNDNGTRPNTVALRFTNITLNAGATVTDAYIQFTGDELSDLSADSAPATTNFVLKGIAAANPATFSTTDATEIANFVRTTATVNWTTVPSWGVDARTTNERTPNLAPLITEIIALGGWASGNSIGFIVEASSVAPISERTAYSFERAITTTPAFAPELVVTFNTPASAGDWAMYN